MLASDCVEEEVEPTDFAPVDEVRGLELDAMVMVSTGASVFFPRSEPAGVVSPVETACEVAEKREGESSPLSVVVTVDAVEEMDEPEGVRDTEFASSSGGGALGDRGDLEWRGKRADASACGSSIAAAADTLDMREEEARDERGV